MKIEKLNYSIKTGEKDEEGNDIFTKHSVDFNIPVDLDEMSQVWGANVAYEKAMATIIIDARRLCYKAKDNAEAQDLVSKWIPGVSTGRSGMTKKELVDLLGDMSEEEITALKEMAKQRREAQPA